MFPRFVGIWRQMARQQAKRNVDSGLAGLKRWWTNKYKLPPDHKLFTEQSMAALNLEMFEDLWLREAELAERASSDEGMVLNEVQAQLQEIRRALGILEDFGVAKVTGTDPLVDQWERDIAAGRTPDLDAKVSNDDG